MKISNISLFLGSSVVLVMALREAEKLKSDLLTGLIIGDIRCDDIQNIDGIVTKLDNGPYLEFYNSRLIFNCEGIILPIF